MININTNIKPNEPFDAEKEKAEYEKYILSQKSVDYKGESILTKNKEIKAQVENKNI